jgi:hypothetical protein
MTIYVISEATIARTIVAVRRTKAAVKRYIMRACRKRHNARLPGFRYNYERFTR